jgi:hypothetical protein
VGKRLLADGVAGEADVDSVWNQHDVRLT